MPYHNWGFPRLGSRTGANVYGDLLGVRNRILGIAYGVSLNATSTDVAIVPILAVPGGYTGTINYRISALSVTNASATLATSPTISLFTAAAGGGTTLVSAQAVTALITSAVWVDLTLAAGATSGGNILTASNLYIRTGGSNAVAATADFYIYGDVFP
jgi:hypothetical protein